MVSVSAGTHGVDLPEASSRDSASIRGMDSLDASSGDLAGTRGMDLAIACATTGDDSEEEVDLFWEEPRGPGGERDGLERSRYLCMLIIVL